eukprot:scaffold41996_cov32-Prasinocladus_malaysianus.AAC.4
MTSCEALEPRLSATEKQSSLGQNWQPQRPTEDGMTDEQRKQHSKAVDNVCWRGRSQLTCEVV